MTVLHEAFIRRAREHPKKPAIIDRTINRRVTYGKALIGALILRRRFRNDEDRYLGVMIPTSAGAFLSVLGCLMAGKVPVMINYATGAQANCSLAREKYGVKTILTSRALLQKIECPELPGMICLEDLMGSITLFEKAVAAMRSKLPCAWLLRMISRSTADDTVVVLFTSGSEKEPKAVELTHRNIASNIRGAVEVLHIRHDDVGGCVLPVFHSFGQMCQFWLPLSMGMTAVTYANPLDYKTIPRIFREERVTMTAGTPAFLAGYLREAGPDDFKTLRLVVSGADKLPSWLLDAYRRKFGLDVFEGYGVTETSPVVSVNTPEAHRPGSIGRPLPGVSVRIVDLKTNREVPRGAEGKILVKGDLVMKGYLNDVEETSRRIIDGWYDTGDMGMMDEDGFLWHRGRLKRFSKIGGEMISLVRTERVLETFLPEGVECCVVDVHDPVKGARIVAAVTRPVDERDIIRKCTPSLPSIALPKAFIVIPDLPRMGSGKIDFRAVTEMVRRK